MFDFAWSEIALIGVVALVLIGPKDMPVAIKAVSDMVKKARRMASELQSHVDEIVKDTSIAEVRQQTNKIRNFDIRGEIERAVDADGSIRSTLTEDPFRNLPPTPSSPQAVAEAETHVIERPEGADTVVHPPVAAPSFVPPEFAPPEAAPTPAVEPAAPAFIPPNVPHPHSPPPGAPSA
jgi:sec-independent protein translocase protein TatB